MNGAAMSSDNKSKEEESLNLFEDALLMVLGAKRWNGDAVGNYLRNEYPPSKLVINGLAKLLAAQSPDGLVLKLHGQGNGQTSFESYSEYYETLSINEYLERHSKTGTSREALIFDAAEIFQLSEATVRRRVRSYETIRGTDLDVPVSSLNL